MMSAAPADPKPSVVVFSSLFPSHIQPNAGVFVRERMFRVAERMPLAVVAPTPWFPLQSLIRRWRPAFRPGAPPRENQAGIDVWYPRFPSVPGAFKCLDGWAMALAALPRLRALQRVGRLDVLDAHFGYPDGFAATRLGRWLGVPVAVTLRGTEVRHAADPVLGRMLGRALHDADRVFAVSDSLRRLALGLGVPADRIRLIGNGVDLSRFRPLDRAAARAALGLAPEVPVLVSVGGLCERKGFHRVIECLPALRALGTDACLVIVGGPSPEGDWTARLRAQTAALDLGDRVHLTGPRPQEELASLLSAADVFVLATRNEGWANVFLEAMACGLPVVTTDVGGNAEVVCRAELGTVVPFGEPSALIAALHNALTRTWDRAAIRAHAVQNAWPGRVDVLEEEFCALTRHPPGQPQTAGASRQP